jgi:nucleoside-diphosphate kinase
MMEQTLILFKPDACRRGLVGEILARFERRGLRIVGLKAMRPARELLEAHYAEHREKPIFSALLDMMSSGPLVACVLAGDGLVEVTRQLLGDFRGPAPGTIRGDYQTAPMDNLAHASSSMSAATREIQLWFRPEELLLA